MNLRELWRTSPLGLLGSFCAGLVNASFYSLGPVFALGLGFSISGTSTFMASVVFGGLLLQYPVAGLDLTACWMTPEEIELLEASL